MLEFCELNSARALGRAVYNGCLGHQHMYILCLDGIQASCFRDMQQLLKAYVTRAK